MNMNPLIRDSANTSSATAIDIRNEIAEYCSTNKIQFAFYCKNQTQVLCNLLGNHQYQFLLLSVPRNKQL